MHCCYVQTIKYIHVCMMFSFKFFQMWNQNMWRWGNVGIWYYCSAPSWPRQPGVLWTDDGTSHQNPGQVVRVRASQSHPRHWRRHRSAPHWGLPFVFMLPFEEEGHIVLLMSVRPSVRPSVRWKTKWFQTIILKKFLSHSFYISHADGS